MLRNVHIDFVSTGDGKTPVIVQHNFINKDGWDQSAASVKLKTLNDSPYTKPFDGCAC